jgi:hypothetical protein
MESARTEWSLFKKVLESLSGRQYGLSDYTRLIRVDVPLLGHLEKHSATNASNKPGFIAVHFADTY